MYDKRFIYSTTERVLPCDTPTPKAREPRATIPFAFRITEAAMSNLPLHPDFESRYDAFGDLGKIQTRGRAGSTSCTAASKDSIRSQSTGEATSFGSG